MVVVVVSKVQLAMLQLLIVKGFMLYSTESFAVLPECLANPVCASPARGCCCVVAVVAEEFVSQDAQSFLFFMFFAIRRLPRNLVDRFGELAEALGFARNEFCVKLSCECLCVDRSPLFVSRSLCVHRTCTGVLPMMPPPFRRETSSYTCTVSGSCSDLDVVEFAAVVVIP